MARDELGGEEYWVPECVRAYLRGAGYSTRALEDMEPHVREWDRWMRAVGEFYDYRDTDGFGRVYQVHRRTIMPAMRVCREWGSLLLDEKTVVACESRECADWLASLLSTTNFWGRAQETVVMAFGLGTGAFAVWMDVGRRLVRVRHYDARMVVPLSWDAEGVRECAFVTRCFSRGALLDQLQMHVVGDDGAYRIRTVCFDGDGREVAVQSVDLAYDALINEIDAGKMRVFLSDVMFDQERAADGRRVPIPFGKGDCTVFRKVMSTEDTVQEFAPALRTEAQGKAFRLALQVLGDLCGLGVDYFDLDNVGYVKTATEVSSDNSALMRNVRKNENALEGALAGVAHALLACARHMGEGLPDEGGVSVIYDDSIVQDTASEKRQDMDEVAAGLMTREEYRRKWYGDGV